MNKLNINSISTEEYQKLIEHAEILEKDTSAAKVLKLLDGSFLKLFRRKRWFSSELIYPYVKRFANNAIELTKLAVETPQITALYRFCSGKLNFTAVRYIPLPGITLRAAMQAATNELSKGYMSLFGDLLANLHQQGVYFRSIHLGNVLLLPNGRLGLIDFADMTKHSHPLSQLKRARNLKHLQRYQEDANWLFGKYFSDFYNGYKKVAGEKASRFLRSS